MLHRNLECEIHESRKIGSGQTGDGKNEHWHFRNQWTKMDEVFLPTPRKGNAKECSKYCTIALISHASKVMLKILQVSLQQYMNQEIPDVQAGFRKGRWIRDQIANIHWIIGKTRKFKKKSTSLTMLKSLTVWITTNWKILQVIGIPDHLSWPLRNLYAGQESTEQDMEQWTGSKLGKVYSRLYIVTLLI